MRISYLEGRTHYTLDADVFVHEVRFVFDISMVKFAWAFRNCDLQL